MILGAVIPAVWDGQLVLHRGVERWCSPRPAFAFVSRAFIIDYQPMDCKRKFDISAFSILFHCLPPFYVNATRAALTSQCVTNRTGPVGPKQEFSPRRRAAGAVIHISQGAGEDFAKSAPRVLGTLDRWAVKGKPAQRAQ